MAGKMQVVKSISHESVLNKALYGVDESVDVLRAIINSPAEAKDKIAATKALREIYAQMLEAGVVEQLPLLKELEEYARKSA
jgi:hypothetical protein